MGFISVLLIPFVMAQSPQQVCDKHGYERGTPLYSECVQLNQGWQYKRPPASPSRGVPQKTLTESLTDSMALHNQIREFNRPKPIGNNVRCHSSPDGHGGFSTNCY